MEGASDTPLFDGLADAESRALARCRHAVLGVDRPLRLDCGVDLGPYRVAYQTYGTLNAEKSNAVLICHALTLDQFVAEQHPVTGKDGLVGRAWSGRARCSIPTAIFIICTNVLGGCMGTTGPLACDPAGRPAVELALSGGHRRRHGARPGGICSITSASSDLFCVIGGSMGGMQVLQWAASYPARVFSAVPIACAAAPFGAEHRVPRGRPAGDHGRSRMERRRLSPHGTVPAAGLAVARMAAHITYLSEQALQRKFGRGAAGPQCAGASASTPTSRSKAICAIRDRPSSTASTPTATSTSRGRWIISTSPPTMAACWPTPSRARRRASACSPSPATGCYPTRESRDIVRALNAAGANVSFVEIESDKGHDAFLLEEPEMFRTLAGLPQGRGNRARPGRARRDRRDPRRPAAHRRHGRAGRARARCRLRRRLAAGLPGELQEGRCARHGTQPGRRQRLRRRTDFR